MKYLKFLPALLSAIVTIIWSILWGLAGIGHEILPIDSSLYEPITYGAGGVTVFIATLTSLINLLFQKSDKSPDQDNRQTLMEIVQGNWIDGVLKDALRDTVIKLDIEKAPDRVENMMPVELRLKHENGWEHIEHTADVLLKAFHDTDEQLLILGAPGSGKTVLLLQLAERLLDEAKQGKPIPVIFNLASWAEKRESIEEWLIQRFKIDYDTDNKLAQSWIGGDKLIYLLDGFDEVAETHREQCLRELNKFITDDRQLVISSRIKEYEALTQPLKTHYAIEIQPLPDEKFKQLLRDNIPQVAGDIIDFLETDAEVMEEINKPLFINILINTYAEDKEAKPFLAEATAGDTIEKVRQHIIAPYIKRQLQNNPDPTYKNDDTRRYLAWIARNLHQREQTTFYIEMLQPDWLPQPGAARRFRWGGALIVGLIFGLIGGLSSGLSSGLIVGLIFGLIVGLIFGLIVGLSGIDLEQRLQWNMQEARTGLIGGLIFGLIFGLIGGLIFGLIVGLIGGLSVGLSVGLIGGLTGGLGGSSTINRRTNFNQGLYDTLKLGLIFGLIGGLIGGLSGGLIVGLIVGLIGGLIVGLGDVLKHIALRYLLERQNLAPRRFDTFLLHVIDRRIMRRVGGSAIFKHRYLLEYFADYWDKNYAPEFNRD